MPPPVGRGPGGRRGPRRRRSRASGRAADQRQARPAFRRERRLVPGGRSRPDGHRHSVADHRTVRPGAPPHRSPRGIRSAHAGIETRPRAPRSAADGAQLGCRGRAADAAEQPRPGRRRAARRPGRLRRLRAGGPGLAVVRRDRRLAEHDGAGRHAAGAVGQAGRHRAYHRAGAAGAHRELPAGPEVGHPGALPGAGGRRPDHVRADDRRLVDLHRHPGHPAGDVRDLRRGGQPALRRHAGRHAHADRRARRHGRRAAARGDRQRRRGALRRGRPGPGPAPADRRLPRRDRRLAGRGPAAGAAAEAGAAGAVGRRDRQRGRGLPAPAGDLPGHRRGHRPDLGPRRAQRLRPGRAEPRRRAGAAPGQAGGVRPAGEGVDGRALRGDGRVRPVRPGRLRLRQRAARAGPGRRGGRRVLLPGLRARLRPAAVRPRRRAVPVGLPVRRPGRPGRDRPGRARPRSRTTTGCSGGSGSPRRG